MSEMHWIELTMAIGERESVPVNINLARITAMTRGHNNLTALFDGSSKEACAMVRQSPQEIYAMPKIILGPPRN